MHLPGYVVISITLVLFANHQKCFSQTDSISKIPSFVECWGAQPSFPGGRDSMQAFIDRNVRFPAGLDTAGRVIAKFTVGKTGRIFNAVIVKSLCETSDKEVLSLISIMPKWIPAIRNGQPIETPYVLPIFFELK